MKYKIYTIEKFYDRSVRNSIEKFDIKADNIFHAIEKTENVLIGKFKENEKIQINYKSTNEYRFMDGKALLEVIISDYEDTEKQKLWAEYPPHWIDVRIIREDDKINLEPDMKIFGLVGNIMKERFYIRNRTKFVFLDTNPFANHTMEEVMPLLTPEQVDFINSKKWNNESKLRQAQEFAEQNHYSDEE